MSYLQGTNIDCVVFFEVKFIVHPCSSGSPKSSAALIFLSLLVDICTDVKELAWDT